MSKSEKNKSNISKVIISWLDEFSITYYTLIILFDKFFIKQFLSLTKNMKAHDLDMTFTSKRTLSIIPKFITSDPKHPQNNK